MKVRVLKKIIEDCTGDEEIFIKGHDWEFGTDEIRASVGAVATQGKTLIIFDETTKEG